MVVIVSSSNLLLAIGFESNRGRIFFPYFTYYKDADKLICIWAFCASYVNLDINVDSEGTDPLGLITKYLASIDNPKIIYQMHPGVW